MDAYTLSPSDPIIVARAVFDAYVQKDRAAIGRLIAEDFHFTSPLDNRLDRAAYLEICWPNSETVKGFEFIHLVPEGDRVFVTYEGESTDGRKNRNTEILTVRDGKLVEVEVYFGWSIPHEAKPGTHLDEPSD